MDGTGTGGVAVGNGAGAIGPCGTGAGKFAGAALRWRSSKSRSTCGACAGLMAGAIPPSVPANRLGDSAGTGRFCNCGAPNCANGGSIPSMKYGTLRKKFAVPVSHGCHVERSVGWSGMVQSPRRRDGGTRLKLLSMSMREFTVEGGMAFGGLSYDSDGLCNDPRDGV